MELTKRNLWTYTLGSIGRDMAGTLFSGFLLSSYVVFTKDLTAVQFTWISMLMVAARIFDGFNDPIMGNILEVTRTKWGKFKPWIAIGMVLSAIVFIVSFSNTLQGTAYVVLFGVMYFLYSICFTMNDIAYWGMLPSLASKKADRDMLTSRTVLFAGIGGGLAQILVPSLTTGSAAIGGSAVTAYPVISVIFSAAFIGMQMITLLGVKEKPLPPKGEATVNKVGLKTIIDTMRKNDQLLWIMVIFMLNQIANNIMGYGLGSTYIYLTFGYEGSLYTIFLALGAVATGVVMIFYKPISDKFSRAKMIRFSTICIVSGYIAMFLVGIFVPNGPITETAGVIKFVLLMLTNLFASCGNFMFYLILMICIANTVEYNEWKTGTRAEGIIFSVRPFLTKLSFALVTFITWFIYLVSGVLEFTNQISGVERDAAKGMEAGVKNEMIRNILAGVPDGKSAALIACITLIPIVLASIAYVLYTRKFNLTEERYEEILADLETRKAQALPES